MSNGTDDLNAYAPTLAEQLTARFYAWEKRGRGWQVWDEPVDLEPAYEPFFHYCPELGPTAFDDGRKPTDLSLLAEKVRSFFVGGDKASDRGHPCHRFGERRLISRPRRLC